MYICMFMYVHKLIDTYIYVHNHKKSKSEKRMNSNES